MITCAQCGQPYPAASPTCPRCGALNPLASQASAGGAGDQGRPDWMRGVGAPPGAEGPPAGWANMPPGGQQPGMPAQPPLGGTPEQGMFSVGQLISDDALPEWVRNAGPSAAGAAPAQPAMGWDAPAPGWPDPGQPPMAQGGPAALFDDAALPDWLRAAANNQPQAASAHEPSGLPYGSPLGGIFGNPPAPIYSAFPGAPVPGQPYHDPTPGPGGMAGGTLVDAAALPAWLGGSDQPADTLSGAGPLGGGGLSANSLVDANALPEWMRQASGQPPADAMPAAGTVSQWLAGPVTDEPLPGFLDHVYAAADVPRLEPASPWGAIPYPSADARLGAMQAGQLVDPGALPDWLRASEAPAGQAAALGAAGPAALGNGAYAFDAPPPPPPPPPGAGTVFSAADLIEPDALNALAPEAPAPSMAVFSPTAGWSFGDPARAPGVPGPTGRNGASDWSQGGGPAGAAGEGARLPEWLSPLPPGAGDGGQRTRAARDPIPDAELPEWLRGGMPAGAGGAPDQAGAYAGYGSQGGYADGMPPSNGTPFDGAGYPSEGYGGDGYPDEEYAGEYAGAEYADGDPAQGDAYAAHYADRFGVEMPGAAGQFGYEYDYGDAQGQANAPDAASNEQGKKRKRKGLFRRK